MCLLWDLFRKPVNQHEACKLDHYRREHGLPEGGVAGRLSAHLQLALSIASAASKDIDGIASMRSENDVPVRVASALA